MIIKNIKIFSQNIHKNILLVNIILEVQKDFNILFIQKLPQLIICSIPSPVSKKGEYLVEVPNHPNQFTFFRNILNNHDPPRVMLYINIRLTQFCFSLQKDIFNHRDISCISFFNNGFIYFLINIYSDSSQMALKYLKSTEYYKINYSLICDI